LKKKITYVAFIILLIFISCKQIITSENKTNYSKPTTSKINGVSMVSISSPIDSCAFIPVTKINATWVANIPFGFIPKNSATVRYNKEWQWYGEKTGGIIESINLAKEQGLKVLLKPHLWIHDIWVGDLDFDNTKDWKSFESSYSNFILHYAQIADSMKVEAYCVGVELRKIATQRPIFWNELIDSVRTIYSGKLTYAANWDNYETIPFWGKLDYIGIDAYFPISKEKTPSIKSCYEGWESNFKKIKALSKKVNKKVIFTEFGYRNVDYTGKKPWEDSPLSKFNNEGQNNSYQAIFDRFWSEPWFEGGFLWKWYPNHAQAGGKENNRFTPQNKPVEEIIKKQYSQP
jgi:hypothetical protein|tara:strand:- start:23290 stop:24327 length:1038 start_codon:yes stop_codon:yes gene_type:complete